MLDLTPSAVQRALTASAGRVPAVTARMQRRLLSGEPIARLSAPPDGRQARQGAVLALLFPHPEGLAVALTERTAHLGSHAGQISFPGGRIEPSDDSPWHAALRETREEIGIDLAGAEPWGMLDRIYVAASNFFVTGYVAFHPVRPTFQPSPDEVAQVYEVPVHALMDDSFTVGERDAQGQMVLEGYFQYQHVKIWGATAVLLDQLLERIRLGLEAG